MNFESWTTTELFEYAKDTYLISEDEKFEDWMNCRTDLLSIVKENI